MYLMEMERQKERRAEILKIFLLYVALFFLCVLLFRSSSRRESEDFRRLGRMDAYEQEDLKRTYTWPQTTMVTQQNHLIGPGSCPPRCTFKCGKCSPCQPVHVTFPPDTPMIDEYYPEAWRCKCGNHLFMP